MSTFFRTSHLPHPSVRRAGHLPSPGYPKCCAGEREEIQKQAVCKLCLVGPSLSSGLGFVWAGEGRCQRRMGEVFSAGHLLTPLPAIQNAAQGRGEKYKSKQLANCAWWGLPSPSGWVLRGREREGAKGGWVRFFQPDISPLRSRLPKRPCRGEGRNTKTYGLQTVQVGRPLYV